MFILKFNVIKISSTYVLMCRQRFNYVNFSLNGSRAWLLEEILPQICQFNLIVVRKFKFEIAICDWEMNKFS